MIVGEFIDPMMRETERIVARLEPRLRPRDVERCAVSIIGQAVFYRFALPAFLHRKGWKRYPRGFSREVAAHVAAFSLGGMAAVAAGRRGKGPCGRIGAFVAVALLLACGCATAWRPEGDGGWSPARRSRGAGSCSRDARASISTGARSSCRRLRARSTSPRRLAMAADGNRRVAISRRELAAAAEEVSGVRGQLLPSTIGTGRYTWYTDALRNRVPLPTGVGAGPNSAIVIRDKDFGTVNGTIALPIDLSGELRHALGAAQAGYRGERARAVGDHARSAARRRPRLFRSARGRTAARSDRAERRARTASSSPTPRAATRTAGSPRTSCWSCRWRLQSGEEELEQRALAIARARYALNDAIGIEVERPHRAGGRRRATRRANRPGCAARRLRRQPPAAGARRGAAATGGDRALHRARLAASRDGRRSHRLLQLTASRAERIRLGVRGLHVESRHGWPPCGRGSEGAHRGRAQSVGDRASAPRPRSSWCVPPSRPRRSG